MEKFSVPNIAIIGSGRVAKSLALFFNSKGIKITGIHSRNKNTGQECADIFQCDLVANANMLLADLILVAVTDDQTIELINSLPSHYNVIYTAGSIDLNEITHPNSGVFYPLQTFNGIESNDSLYFPVLTESKTTDLMELMNTLCIHCEVQMEVCDSTKRKDYHLVAVFLNNFINHIGHLAKKENDQRNLNWEILKPLIDKTFHNILNNNTLKNQTGPATRRDLAVIKKHENMLNEQSLRVYQSLTESIMKTMNTK